MNGKLIVVGTGIAVGHISAEARAWIEQADKVLYCIADAATERLIQKLNPNTESLYVFYGNDKPRADTYREMVARIVECVREEKVVCAVFYGHPGIFCFPPHEAIKILRSEGRTARMLPAISSLDCLFADLGIDPSTGCQIFEATDLVLRRRSVDTASKVIVWQIACVGDFGFNFRGYDKRNLPLLLEYLQECYGADHPVVLYEAAQYPVCDPVMLEVPLSKVVDSPVTAITTMYIPEKDTAPLFGAMVRRAGLWDYLKDKVELQPRQEPSVAGS